MKNNNNKNEEENFWQKLFWPNDFLLHFHHGFMCPSLYVCALPILLGPKLKLKKKGSFCPLWVSVLAYISSRLTLGVSYSLREKMIKERGGRRGVGWAGVLCCVCCIWLKFSNCILCISDMTSFIVLQNAYLCEWEFLGSVNISTPKMTLVFVAFSPSSV